MIQHSVVSRKRSRDFIVFNLACPLDADSASSLKDRMLQAIELGYTHLVLDVKSMPFIDSDGLRMLAWVADSSEKTIQIELINANKAVSRAIRLTKLDEFYPIFVLS